MVDVEVISTENLRYPFPAITGIFKSKDYFSSVHSAGRIRGVDEHQTQHETLETNWTCKFEKNSIEFCITDIGNVHKDAVSKVFITIMASLAEVEKENISYRIKSAKSELRKQNRFLGGHQPFAFNKTTDGKLEVNPKEAEIYKAIINLKNNKVPLRKISEVIKNKYARKLHYSYISKLLNRPQLSETIGSVA